MKVCLVYMPGLSTIRGGGIANKIKHIVKATNSEIDYSIITSIEKADRADAKFLKDLGVNIFGVTMSRNPVLDFLRLFKCVPNTKFDIIHYHMLPLAWDIRFGLSMGFFLLKQNFRNAVLIYEHQIATQGNLHPLHQTWQYVCFKIFFPLWRKVIVNTNYMLDEALKIIKRSCSEKIELIPLGVDINEIQNSPLQLLEKPSILYFGHLSYIKGVDILMKAFLKVNQRYREVHLYLIGDGPLSRFCDDFIRKEHLDHKVHILGAQSQDKVFGAIRSADICVFPSRNDAGPYTVLEAMAVGKPIVSTRVGGIPEYVKDGRNGLLVSPDPDQLATAIESLLENFNFRSEIEKNNFQDIGAHSWTKATERYVNLYRSLIK